MQTLLRSDRLHLLWPAKDGFLVQDSVARFLAALYERAD